MDECHGVPLQTALEGMSRHKPDDIETAAVADCHSPQNAGPSMVVCIIISLYHIPGTPHTHLRS